MAASSRIPNDECRNPKRAEAWEKIEDRKSKIENANGGEGGITRPLVIRKCARL
jgi:hypothetical protein